MLNLISIIYFIVVVYIFHAYFKSMNAKQPIKQKNTLLCYTFRRDI